MKAAGNRCEIILYEGQGHLGWDKNNNYVYEKIDAFFESNGCFDF